MSVTFNGATKRITVDNGITSLDVKRDIYSSWKRWVRTSDNAKFLQAIRSTGGDPLVGTQTLDGYFFLVNEWKLVPPNDAGTDDIDIDGNLFDDVGGNIFDVSGTGVRLIRLNLSSKSIVTPVTASVVVESVATASYVEYLESGSYINTVENADVTVSNVVTASYVETVGNPVQIAPGTTVTASLDPNTVVTASLTTSQENMLLEVYRLLGLDPTRPLVVSPTSRTAGSEISQSISLNGSEYTAQRL